MAAHPRKSPAAPPVSGHINARRSVIEVGWLTHGGESSELSYPARAIVHPNYWNLTRYTREQTSIGVLGMRASWLVVPLMSLGLLAGAAYDDAQRLYQRTDYQGALRILLAEPQKDARAWSLIGQAYFMQAEYKKATDAFEKALAADPNNSVFEHWLGRAWGRRAESANPIMAAAYASRARQHFERAVMLDPRNQEALNDLFDYCLQAPGFLGGGFEKAQAIAERIARLDPAEGHYARAQLADKRKEFAQAEEQLRRALELAPRQVGRVIDLAKYLSKLGRYQESDAVFAQAEKMAPESPRVLYERAETYIRDNRNLKVARQLLERYISATNLTPDDPPRSRAAELLEKTKGA
jgi:tetratricopeptide (TPR) repeat protein